VTRYVAAAELPPVPLGRESTEGRAKSSWRTYRPVIDHRTCTRCNLCWKFCPDVAIIFDGSGYPVVRDDLCKGCGICAEVCVPKAIAMVREG